ncbi:hypothetical protein NEMIN01_0863 [Nematocida minor]|uniref:uncharacterized protein n=1 Tax=Nematocida minor TaxID=1912983 RepID=UPI00221FBD6A|nr:uncharacterized protein NEMIN01_0863 [Nematocida minor]KAI5190078.1 hypothetical protein NEMIN01_0863 [Nematocida minor]
MSQWSRRKVGGLPVRNLSLPIFFGGISEENQTSEIKEALKNTRYCSLTKTRTINLSCLAIKNLPINSLLASIREESFTLNERVDYEMVFTETKIVLNLEGNLLETIPVELFSALNIQVILLRSNKLQTISSKIADLKSLQTLTLSNNPIRYLPVEILSLPITLFTISERHFLTDEEMDNMNSQVVFKETTLNELCLKNVMMDDILSIRGTAINKPQGECYGCRSLTTSTNLVFKKIEYKGICIPFAMRVCSVECKDKCLSPGETPNVV